MQKVALQTRHASQQHPPVRRYELKYVLRPDVAERVGHSLNAYLEPDQHCSAQPSRTYTVRSIYFDSMRFDCYYEKLGGQYHREKFRIRTYNQAQSAPLILENKIKQGSAYVKIRTTLTDGLLKAISSRDYDALRHPGVLDGERQALDKFFFQIHRNVYNPTALVVYDREAYVYPGQDTIRVTLDRNLRALMFPALEQIHEQNGLETVLQDAVILEIKFSRVLPSSIGWLRNRFRLQNQACSKYCTCVGHFLGGIPSFKDGVAHVRTG